MGCGSRRPWARAVGVDRRVVVEGVREDRDVVVVDCRLRANARLRCGPPRALLQRGVLISVVHSPQGQVPGVPNGCCGMGHTTGRSDS